MRPLSSEELKKLKVGDKVYISGRYVKVEKVGRKYVHIHMTGSPIVIETAALQYNGYGSCDTPKAFRDEEAYTEHKEYLTEVRNFYTQLRNAPYPDGLSYEAMDEIRKVLHKHNLIKGVK